MCVCVTTNTSPSKSTQFLKCSTLIKQFFGFNHVHEMNKWSQKLSRKLRASSTLKQPLLQLYLILSCNLTVIAFKQDELCFHVLVCYQSLESRETAIVSCKKCHNFITERFQRKPVYYFASFGSSIEVPMLLALQNFVHTQTD